MGFSLSLRIHTAILLSLLKSQTVFPGQKSQQIHDTLLYNSLIVCIFPQKESFAKQVQVQILELYTEMTREGRGIVFIWVPSHVGIRGNSAADSAAKDALDGDISVELRPK